MGRFARGCTWALIAVSMLLAGVGDIHAKQTTTTTVSSSPNPSSPGGTVTFTATVSSDQSGQSNQHCPDGTVQFQINGVNFGGPVRVTPLSVCNVQGAIASATASITTSFPQGGSYPVVAIYGDDHDFESSTSQAYTQVVGEPAPIATSTSLASSANPAVAGTPVTFTAVVTPAEWGFGVPSGTVLFTMGSTTLFIGPLTEGWVSFTTSSLPEGANSIQATYSGDDTFSGSGASLVQSIGAQSKTGTTLALASWPASVIAGDTVWLTATVTPAEYVAGVPSGTVTFTSGTLTITAPLNEDGWVTVATQALPLGANTVSATYGGDAHYGPSSATLVELVNAPSSVPTRVELVGAPSTTIVGAPVWLTVNVIPDVWVAAGDPTGTVTVHLTDAQGNKSTVFSGALPPAGWVTFTTTSLPPGSNTLTATYSGDANYAASVSAPISQQVGPAPGKIPTSLALVAAPTVTMAGEPIWLTATVTPAEWTFGVPVGTVTFTGGNVTLSGTLSIGDWVTLATSAIAQGTNTITATYSGDPHYASSSGTTVVTVNSLGIDTTSAMISWNNPSAFGDAVAISVNVMPGQWGYGWPVGTVTLTAGGLTLSDTLTDGWTVFVTSALPPGTHTVTATYGGSSIFKPSTATITQTVQPR